MAITLRVLGHVLSAEIQLGGERVTSNNEFKVAFAATKPLDGGANGGVSLDRRKRHRHDGEAGGE